MKRLRNRLEEAEKNIRMARAGLALALANLTLTAIAQAMVWTR